MVGASFSGAWHLACNKTRIKKNKVCLQSRAGKLQENIVGQCVQGQLTDRPAERPARETGGQGGSTSARPLLERHKKFAKVDKISRKCHFPKI